MENKRKIIIYAVFFLSVIYAGWFHFIRSQDAADKKNSAIMKSNIPNTGHSGAALLSDSGLSVDKIELAKTQPIPDGWGRDPFSDHSTSGASNNSRLSPASPGIPRLTANFAHCTVQSRRRPPIAAALGGGPRKIRTRES